jgi:hypothetical protein
MLKAVFMGLAVVLLVFVIAIAWLVGREGPGVMVGVNLILHRTIYSPAFWIIEAVAFVATVLAVKH